MRNKRLAAFLGALIFFITTAAIVSVAVLAYAYADSKSGGDKRIAAVVMLLTILFLASVCTVIDIVRRKLTVEKPVDMILDAAEKIASGDFSVKLEPRHRYGSYDEYDAIMENINIMALELGKSEIMKTDFISNVSHEIKTPLAVIQSYASIMKKSDISAEDREAYADTITDASKKLSALVGNILKLNKLENGVIKPEYEKTSIDGLLVEAVLAFEDKIESKNITLNCDFEEVSLITSKGLLEIVFNNLISNAVKFTENGGKIFVSLKAEGDACIVSVSDNGVGISREAGERIFEKFYQSDTSHSAEGNGLGLPLVKKVIDILGGEISVKSEPGKGSTFTVVIKDNFNEKK